MNLEGNRKMQNVSRFWIAMSVCFSKVSSMFVGNKGCRALSAFMGSQTKLASSCINPITGRRIKVNGQVFNKTLSEGGYIFHNGEIHPINVENGYDISLPKALTHDTGRLFDELDRKGDVLFVFKPSGLLSVPGIGPEKMDCLATRVKSKYPAAKICHRLDRDTSGIMAFGLNASAHRLMSKRFESKQIQKVYFALVEGHIRDESGQINLPIGKQMTDQGFNRWVIGGTKQREAITRYQVFGRFMTKHGFKYSKIKLWPLTGRGHQIRLHMKVSGLWL